MSEASRQRERDRAAYQPEEWAKVQILKQAREKLELSALLACKYFPAGEWSAFKRLEECRRRTGWIRHLWGPECRTCHNAPPWPLCELCTWLRDHVWKRLDDAEMKSLCEWLGAIEPELPK